MLIFTSISSLNQSNGKVIFKAHRDRGAGERQSWKLEGEGGGDTDLQT